ncbi:MAG: hypothetical protein ACRD17_07175 [Terriglobales bacterium]
MFLAVLIAMTVAAVGIGVEFRRPQPAPLQPYVAVWLIIWCVLLIPWALFAALSGMAFDGGDTFSAYFFVWSVWTYPVSLLIAFLFRRKCPALVFLPMIHGIAIFA